MLDADDDNDDNDDKSIFPPFQRWSMDARRETRALSREDR